MQKPTLMSKDRIDWIDHAKGFCIVAVVAMYTTTYVEQILNKVGWMHRFIDFAQPFRMPDFFLISGLLIGRVINRPLRSYIDSKVLHFIYFYAVWVTIKFVIIDGKKLFDANYHNVFRDYLSVYIEPHGPLWFIYILPIFFIVSRLVRSIPGWLVVAAAILIKLADLQTGWKLIDRFGIYFVFFYSGHIFSHYIFRIASAARDNPRITMLILGLWGILNAILVDAGLTFHPYMHLITGLAGACAIIALSVLMANWHAFDWLRYLGQNSLVVYLAFVVPLALVRRLISSSITFIDPGTVAILVTTFCIVGSLFIYRIVRNTPFRFLFARPAFVSVHSKAPPLTVYPEKN